MPTRPRRQFQFVNGLNCKLERSRRYNLIRYGFVSDVRHIYARSPEEAGKHAGIA